MAILDSTPIDYSDLDFDSARARLYNLISSAYPAWTDKSVANFGNILVELMSHVADTTGFYIDNRARESRIAQASQRKSVVDLVKLIGYAPRGATAATVDISVTLAEVPSNDVIIPVGTIVRTRAVTDPLSFQTTATLTIAAGTSPPVGTVGVENSTSYTETFTSTGLANQAVRLANTPFIDTSETLSAANGAYTRATNFLYSTAADRHYTVSVDDGDRATVRFGNGISGQLPSGVITAVYKTGGGSAGNVEPGAVSVIEGTIHDVMSNPVVVSVTNLVQATGGRARESRQAIQQNGPESLRALTRTVSREDYEINAKRVAGVSRALMLTSNEYDVVQENTGTLYIVPSGGGTASTSTLNAVTAMITTEYPHTITFRPSVLSASYLVIDVQTSVHLRKGAVPATVKAAIVAALTAYFTVETVGSDGEATQNSTVDFGYYLAQNSDGDFDGELALSDVMNVVRDTAGVRKLGDSANDFLVNGAHSDLPILVYQFPKLGTVTVINAETGTPI